MATITTVAESMTKTAPQEEPRPYRLTAEQYFRLIKAGVLADKAPVFLWNGQLVEKRTSGPEHGYSQTMITTLLNRIVPDGWHARPALPVEVDAHHVPEPDVSVVRGTAREHQHQTPRAEDVALAVEVSDSSLPFDSRKKRDVYAEASIPVYWIINIPENRIDVYSEPTGPSETHLYRTRRSYSPGEEVPIILDGREVGRIAVSDVL
jgi:Uma2 family endonuclease